jgi:hypothetical protein
MSKRNTTPVFLTRKEFDELTEAHEQGRTGLPPSERKPVGRIAYEKGKHKKSDPSTGSKEVL